MWPVLSFVSHHLIRRGTLYSDVVTTDTRYKTKDRCILLLGCDLWPLLRPRPERLPFVKCFSILGYRAHVPGGGTQWGSVWSVHPTPVQSYSSCVCTANWHGTHCSESHDDCTSASNRELCDHGTCVNVARVQPGQVRELILSMNRSVSCCQHLAIGSDRVYCVTETGICM